MTLQAPVRTRRRDPGEGRVVPREALALLFLAEAQPIHTGHWADLLGVMSRPIALRSIRKLRDLGCLTVHVVSMNDPNYLTLARGARPHLVRLTGRDPDCFLVPKTLERASLAHHTLGVDFAVALRVGAARSRHLDLVRYAFERELRAPDAGRAGAQRLVPDGVAVLANRAGDQVAVALEVDRGTERNPSFLTPRKLVPYASAYSRRSPLFGCTAWRVAFVMEERSRIQAVMNSVWREGLPLDLFHFIDAASLSASTVLTDAPWIAVAEGAGGQPTIRARSPFGTGKTGW